MWWMDGSRSDKGREGAAAVCNTGDRWKAFPSKLGTGRLEVYTGELWANRHALWVSVRKRDTLQTHRVMQGAVFSAWQAAIRRMEHLEPRHGQPLDRCLNHCARDLPKAIIHTEIHWVAGHTGNHWNKEADR